MRFEAKHKELKETAHSITSRKNITLTLVLKQQLQLADRLLISDNNMYTIKTDIGPIVILQDIIELYASNTLFLSTKVDFFKDNIVFISWVCEKGIKYSCKSNMTVVLNVCEKNNYMLPCFGLIKSIFMTDSNVPFLLYM